MKTKKKIVSSIDQLCLFFKPVKNELIVGGVILLIIFLLSLGKKEEEPLANGECRHNWKLYKELITVKDDNPEDITGFKKVYECSKCKNFIVKEISIKEDK